ncbi:MAG TPA: hypothetical protein VFQ96_07210 [Microbacteriaceae bacterium]|nr:hypothetical protein [Microbacteriaceae bacterium]
MSEMVSDDIVNLSRDGGALLVRDAFTVGFTQPCRELSRQWHGQDDQQLHTRVGADEGRKGQRNRADLADRKRPPRIADEQARSDDVRVGRCRHSAKLPVQLSATKP